MDLIPAAEIACALDELVSLVDQQLPKSFEPDGGSKWPAIAAGMTARMADIATSAAVLLRSGCYADAFTVTRIMYEQMVVYCWIAADPELHLPLWEHADWAAQIKVHSEALREYGIKVLSDETYELHKDDKPLPGVLDLVKAIDRHWPDRISAFRKPNQGKLSIDILTLSGLYLGLFRTASRVVHAKAESLERVVRPKEGGGLIVERGYDKNHGLIPTIVPLFTMALTVQHFVFGWPDDAAAKAINDKIAWEPAS